MQLLLHQRAYIEEDCRKKVAGEPRDIKGEGKSSGGRSMRSLENQQGDWERETQDQGAERPLGALERSCGSLEFELCRPCSPVELELDAVEMLGQG